MIMADAKLLSFLPPSLCRGWQGLVAYASHSTVVVIDPRSIQPLQTLSAHKTNVIKVRTHQHSELWYTSGNVLLVIVIMIMLYTQWSTQYLAYGPMAGIIFLSLSLPIASLVYRVSPSHSCLPLLSAAGLCRRYLSLYRMGCQPRCCVSRIQPRGQASGGPTMATH